MNIAWNPLTGRFSLHWCLQRHQRSVLTLMVVSEGFPSSLQINQKALLWNNEDSQNSARRGRPTSEHGLKGCFVAPSQRSSSWFHQNTPRPHPPIGCGAVKYSLNLTLLGPILIPLSHFFFSFSLLQMPPSKGHSLPRLLRQGAMPPMSDSRSVDVL